MLVALILLNRRLSTNSQYNFTQRISPGNLNQVCGKLNINVVRAFKIVLQNDYLQSLFDIRYGLESYALHRITHEPHHWCCHLCFAYADIWAYESNWLLRTVKCRPACASFI